MKEKPLISICIPVYEEAENVAPLVTALDEFSKSEPNYRFEFVFCDNDSRDDTFEKLVVLAESDTRIRIIRLSRNFGFQRSLLTCYGLAKGTAAVQLDADLQDPPRVISEFLRKWEEGYAVVYGIRRSRKENFLKRAFRRFGYWLISRLGEIELPQNTGDFRLIDRKVIEHLGEYETQTPYVRGMIASIGYPQSGVLYDREARKFGRSKFGFWRLIRFGMDGLCGYSTKPLELITFFGVLLGLLTFALAGYYFLQYLAGDAARFEGFTTIVLLILASLSINAFFLGVIGEYVGRTFKNSSAEPLSIIRDRIEPLQESDKRSKQ